MRVLDPGKLTLLAIALVGGFVLQAMGDSAGGYIVVGVVGYLTGNGRLAARGLGPVPALGRPELDPHARPPATPGDPYTYPGGGSP